MTLMNKETIAAIHLIRDMAAILLSGFAPANIPLALAGIVLAAQKAHVAHAGVPIDPDSIKWIEKLTLEDLPHVGEVTASSIDSPSGDSVPDRGTAETLPSPAGDEEVSREER